MASITVLTNTNYINFMVNGLPDGYGMPSTATHFLFINWSDDLTNWHEGGLLLTNGWSVAATNKHRYYRLRGAPLIP